MTRRDWNILMLSIAACVVAVMMFAVVAQAAPLNPHLKHVMPGDMLWSIRQTAQPIALVSGTGLFQILECDGKMHDVGNWGGVYTEPHLMPNLTAWERQRIAWVVKAGRSTAPGRFEHPVPSCGAPTS